MHKIRVIDAGHKQDINLKNEPFALFGRMIPSYTDETWHYTVEKVGIDEVSEMCFPDENYVFEAMRDCVFLGAYDEGECVGLAILRDAFFRYMYLYDLKVNSAYRGRGVAAQLMDKAKEIAVQKGYRGLYTQAQDNNLAACLFYIKTGFRIGGLDTDVYKGSNQEGKSDIIFYLDF